MFECPGLFPPARTHRLSPPFQAGCPPEAGLINLLKRTTKTDALIRSPGCLFLCRIGSAYLSSRFRIQHYEVPNESEQLATCRYWCWCNSHVCIVLCPTLAGGT